MPVNERRANEAQSCINRRLGMGPLETWRADREEMKVLHTLALCHSVIVDMSGDALQIATLCPGQPPNGTPLIVPPQKVGPFWDVASHRHERQIERERDEPSLSDLWGFWKCRVMLFAELSVYCSVG